MATTSNLNVEPEVRPVIKGKGRARAPETERTPLLASQTSASANNGGPSTPVYYHELGTSTRARQRLWSKLTCIFLSSLLFCITIFLLLAILAYSYAARLKDVSPEDLVNQALRVQGPDRVDVIDVTEEGGLWVNVEGRVGIDAGSVIGVNTDDDEGTFTDMWKSLGRWGVNLLSDVSVDLSTIHITSPHDPSTKLASISAPPISIPITSNPPRDFSWLTPITVPVYVLPTQNVSALMQFVRDTWSAGAVSIQIQIAEAAVTGGLLNETGWRHTLKFEQRNIGLDMTMKIPPLPGLPPPGHSTPFPSFSQLVTLQSFMVSSESKEVRLQAQASLVNPAPLTFNLTMPTLPFIISLPSPGKPSRLVPIASVHSRPFTSTHPNITLIVSGTVLPLPTNASSVLSTFVSRYLSLDLNPIMISTPIFPSLIIDTDFPAPNPRPQVMRNVTIRDMKIKPDGASGGFLASGTVYARIVLPKGMNLSLDVNRVFPDVLVFDGEVPQLPPLPLSNTHGEGDVPNPPLPNPLPERAFAHIRPDDWLFSTSVPDPTRDDEGAAFAVTANLVDIPMEVLPGRQKEFSNFVSKVIFGSQGALAGLQGSAAVGVYVHGMPFNNGDSDDNEMELTGLPFQGSVRIGKKTLLIHEMP
ncbi:hypothetical protein SERLA73DRAFT_159693 [Serpula lacrymans var. lacrymans S7.3]|uniref:Uncharacterized protein n=2 Tax=Serpula lacrymans var. lacrymans TaxID=341189 RepID=F8PRX2_SERL3|nr:uncharacterized protein SERLADRAFT_436682 [Serpula lacrymans var. lacrymans S7.9]EGO01207.1 hypothetical protein SERLA73DRAFT_159693 [Serpula lacrymans var. lacrymans S7.3]EGO26856.1 hypothetical protein SERLADRAFT_436682 [Serpula lacrymans var. lacrymans S7.9]